MTIENASMAQGNELEIASRAGAGDEAQRLGVRTIFTLPPAIRFGDAQRQNAQSAPPRVVSRNRGEGLVGDQYRIAQTIESLPQSVAGPLPITRCAHQWRDDETTANARPICRNKVDDIIDQQNDDLAWRNAKFAHTRENSA
jgi:hypothetical protein